MSLLKIALEKQRWDLAAHTIVLAAAKAVNRGVSDAGKKRKRGLKAAAGR